MRCRLAWSSRFLSCWTSGGGNLQRRRHLAFLIRKQVALMRSAKLTDSLVTALAYSPNSHQLAIGSYRDSTHLWNHTVGDTSCQIGPEKTFVGSLGSPIHNMVNDLQLLLTTGQSVSGFITHQAKRKPGYMSLLWVCVNCSGSWLESSCADGVTHWE